MDSFNLNGSVQVLITKRMKTVKILLRVPAAHLRNPSVSILAEPGIWNHVSFSFSVIAPIDLYHLNLNKHRTVQ